MKDWLKSSAIRLTANEFAQGLIERTVGRLHFLMGIGSGSYVESSRGGRPRREVDGTPHQRPTAVRVRCGRKQGSVRNAHPRRLTGDFHIHCFEPARGAFEVLSARFAKDPRFVLNTFGLGSSTHEAQLHYDEQGSGLASVYKQRLDHQPLIKFTESEQISIRTLDEYCEEKGIPSIDLLKIDTEGHEMDVLRGAERMLAQRKIKMISFAFGGCNIDSRTYFQDFVSSFRVLADAGSSELLRRVSSCRCLAIVKTSNNSAWPTISQYSNRDTANGHRDER